MGIRGTAAAPTANPIDAAVVVVDVALGEVPPIAPEEDTMFILAVMLLLPPTLEQGGFLPLLTARRFRFHARDEVIGERRATTRTEVAAERGRMAR